MADRILGTTDDDEIFGTSRDETFKTLTGDDFVDGGGGNDIIITNEGNDILLGGAGDDQLYGCEDDDILDGGAGSDFLNGGTGNDLLIFRASENTSAAPDYYDGYEDADTLRLILTQAEFNAARSDIQAFQAFLSTQANAPIGQQSGDLPIGTTIGNTPFFYFASLNLSVRRVEFLQVVVDGEFVIGEPDEEEPDLVLVDDAQDFTVGEPLNATVATNDTVPDGSVFSVVETVQSGTLVLAEDGSYTFDAGSAFDDLGAGETRTVSFTYQVTSPGGAQAQAVATITVTGVNDAPVAGEDVSLTVSETDEVFALNVLEGATDVDGDDLSIGEVRVTSGNGDAVLSSTGSVEFDPSVFVDELDEGETATVTIEVDIEDGNGGTDTRTFTITVEGVTQIGLNAQDDMGDLLVGEVLDGSVATNDTLPAGSVFSIVEDVERGTLTLNENGTFSFDPGSDFDDLIIDSEGDAGTSVETFTYRVTSPDGQTATATVTLTVEASNSLPTRGGSTSFGEGNPGFQGIDLSFLLGLNTADQDVDGDDITISNAVLLDGSGNALSVEENGFLDGLVYQFDRTAFQFLNDGEDLNFILRYDVSDGTATRKVQTSIFLSGTEDSPVAGDTITLDIQESADVIDLTALVLASVTDVDQGDNDILSIVSIGGGSTTTPPEGAVLNNGVLTFDPVSYADDLEAGETLTVTIAVRVDDDFSIGTSNTSAIQLVEITIVGETAANNPPVVDNPFFADFQEDTTIAGDPLTFDLTSGVSDPDGDVLEVSNITSSYSAAGSPVFSLGADNRTLTIDATQAVFQSIAVGQTETLTLTYDVSDGRGGTVEQTATFEIIGLNDNPNAGNDLVFTVSESDGPLDINGLLGASDIDNGDTLSFDGYTLISGDDRGFISSLDFIEVDPTAYSDLEAGETEVIVIEIEVTDGNGGSDTRLATITIEGESDTASNPPGNFTDGSTLFEFSATEGGDLLQSNRLSDVITTPDGNPVEFDSFVTPAFAGLTYDVATQIFTFDPTDPAYDSLQQGERLTLLTVIQVKDAQGGLTDVELTFDVIGTNDGPTVAAPLTFATLEDSTIEVINLFEGVSDADDGDLLYISNIIGTQFGMTVDALTGDLIVDTTSPGFDFIAQGVTETFTISYNITDSFGATVQQTLTLNVEGFNDAPEIESELEFTIQADIEGATENNDNLRREIDLLAAVFDPDGDEFALVDFEFDGVTDEGAYSIDFDTGILTVDYNNFQATVFEPFTLRYTVEDANGERSFFDAAINVIPLEANTAPVSSDILDVTLSPSTATTADLFANITDADGDPLVIEQVIGLNSVFFDFSTGSFDGSGIVDSVSQGDSFELFFTILVGDETGGSVSQDVIVTFVGENDGPSAGTLQTDYTFTEDDGIVLIDLLDGITDANGDRLTVTNISDGTLLNDRYLRLDTGEFSFLTTGEDDMQTITVTLTDGFVTEQYDLNITVNGVDDLPVITRTARFFDNDVSGYQTSGGQQNFIIRAEEVFDDGDNSDPLGGPDDRFTSVTLVSGPAITVSINANGEIEVSQASLEFLLAAGERADFVFDFEGITGDGNIITGQINYRVEGTNDTGVVNTLSVWKSGLYGDFVSLDDILYVMPNVHGRSDDEGEGGSGYGPMSPTLLVDFGDPSDDGTSDDGTPPSPYEVPFDLRDLIMEFPDFEDMALL